MTDLSRVLPGFPTAQYAGLLPALENNKVTTAELLTLDLADLGKRTKLPLLDLKRLCNAVLEALHVDLGVSEKQPDKPSALKQTASDLAQRWSTISTLDESLDHALGGGVPTGYVTEIVGESGAGKTQFLLTMLLAVQLPPPHGLGRPALYISTEAPLSTTRLAQMLRSNPFFKGLDQKPTLDRIMSTATPDLESQEHILQYQVPVQVERHNVGLIVLDSVAANYRAEYERGGSLGSNMAARSADLIRMGHLLHDLARRHNLAVVVANQVMDRIPSSHSGSGTPGLFAIKSSVAATPKSPLPALAAVPSSTPNVQQMPQDSPLASRSRGPWQPPPGAEPTSSLADMVGVRSSMPEPPPEDPPAPASLLLDHQNRWVTGWGDDPYANPNNFKTPTLGLVWSTQIASRIALLKRPVYGRKEIIEDEDLPGGGVALRNWRRWMKVVFAPHVPGTGQGLDGAVEFEVNMGGLKSIEKDKRKE
ncbi:GTP-binding protein y.t1.c1 [Apiospora rasikravindrae]|uniref:GTP-binding protein y.t1.c1 n=1 Tax=Apiospora rasikravindrae TaxID=990691 RepID=A0ABR1SZI7_9PEZI